MVDLFWHKHPLAYTLCRVSDCQECHDDTMYHSEVRNYRCIECSMEWHHSCVPTKDEYVEHPCHPSHLLKLLLQGPPSYSSNGNCSLCQRKLSNFVFQCTICDFSIDMNCKNKSPLVKVYSTKCHNHPLTLMARDVSFTCNACGKHGERNPYVCLPCSLMFHYECIDLPYVININRHEHRVSHANVLRPGNWVCEICRQVINWRYGAYSCNKCPDFFVHSRCATRNDVWDGAELKDVPEEVLDTAPFKVISEGVINHFSHEEHNLLLIEDVIKDVRCEACARPISSEKHYNCTECSYILHEECANLPLKRRHGLSTSMLSLFFGKNFKCVACHRYGYGFGYTDGEDVQLDVRCASTSCFRQHKLHPHTLFLTTVEHGTCVSCDDNKSYVLGCVECEYSLDFKCATLPLVIKHKFDAHYLVLRSGEVATGKYWCEICETETNPNKWFYTCDYCGVVCHIDCVVGDSLNLKPGSVVTATKYETMLGIFVTAKKYEIEAVLNDHNSRPKCYSCGSRCRFPMAYKTTNNNIESYHCSLLCYFTDI